MDSRKILNLPMEDNDADAATIGDYLAILLQTVLEEGESFSGKRPFGNSGWISELITPLVHNNLIDGSLDEDGNIIEASDEEAIELLCRCIDDILVTTDK